MPTEERWTIRIMRKNFLNGRLVGVYAHVYSSTDEQARGSIDIRGQTTSNLLSVFQMCSPTLTVIDCSPSAISSRKTNNGATEPRQTSWW